MIGEVIVLLIKEDFNLLLTEVFQLKCKKKLSEEINKNEVLLMRLILREISNGNIASAHMSKERARKTLKIVSCMYGEEFGDFKTSGERDFYMAYDGLCSSSLASGELDGD